MRNRAYARLKAKLLGYFWVPCPKCGQMFGGHEATGHSIAYNREGVIFGAMVCPDCSDEMESRGTHTESPWGDPIVFDGTKGDRHAR